MRGNRLEVVSGSGGGSRSTTLSTVVRSRADDIESGGRPVTVTRLASLVLLDRNLLEDRVLRVPVNESLVGVEGDGELAVSWEREKRCQHIGEEKREEEEEDVRALS